MKKHKIFKTNPHLKEVHSTSDGELFYNDNDAKMHAKSLEDKSVEPILNPDFLIDEVDLEDDDENTFNLDKATKKEIVSFAKENYNLDLDEKSKKTDLWTAIENHIASNENGKLHESEDVKSTEGAENAEQTKNEQL